MKAANASRAVLPSGISTGPPPSTRLSLYERLQERREEIEQAVLVRVYGVSDPAEVGDPVYLEGLKTAVAAAIECGLQGIHSRGRKSPPIPSVLLAQARIAARNGIALDTVARRYFAGYAVLGDFLLEESQREELRGDALKDLLRDQAAILDRLLAAVGEEHLREAEMPLRSAEGRRMELVQRILSGERLDASELSYELEAIHLGLIAQGSGVDEVLRELARAFDRRLLLVRRDAEVVWGWLGGRREVDHDDLECLLAAGVPADVRIAFGEPGEGVGGWRLSHRQAKAALPIAICSSERFIRYADVALLAAILQDDLLATSLREIYLAPLEEERDGGESARETLRAYFDSDRNISSAAAVLRISRQAVAKRLACVEERLACSLSSSGLEIEAAIRMEDLKSMQGQLAT